MVTSLLSTDDLGQARALVEASGLRFEAPYDDLVGVFEAGRLVAVGARQGRVLKMLAVAPSHQGGTLLDEVVTELVGRGYQDGVDSFFVFTSPALVPGFESLNFNLLVASGTTALLEYGDGLRRYLSRYAKQVRPGDNGAIVANCNPFTLGHRYLVEQAAAAVDQLFLFVVREERSLFPFGARLRMVQEGTADLENVVVLDTSWYAVSSITFPTYFLKGGDPGGAIQMELDLLLFARHIAPHFHVKTRFVGSEPWCGTTAAYNEAMHQVLPPLGVEVREIERKSAMDRPISASRVRDMLLNGELEGIAELVPVSTLDFLLSSEGIKIWVKGGNK